MKTARTPNMTASHQQLQFAFDASEPEESMPPASPHDASEVLALLEAWLDSGWLRELEVRFARFLHEQCADAAGLMLLGAALASHQLARGHVCLDLAATLQGPDRVLNLPPDERNASGEECPPTPAQFLANVSLDEWAAALQSAAVSDGQSVAPLVYQSGRLYLYRYWKYEQQVANGILARLQYVPDREPDVRQIRQIIDVLFGPPNPCLNHDGQPDWQRVACALAAKHHFAVVTGGPGTGKTTTVVRLLALLQALHASAATPLRIRLAAPTGKAAARLSESIAGKINGLPFDRLPGGADLARTIPSQVLTLHRLLGGRPHSQRRRYNADEPLPVDVLVIDEASMVSLSDMADVIAALPHTARLILIGDKDQLSSVEAGAVLGELCRRAEAGHYSPSMAAWLAQASGMPLPSHLTDTDGHALDQAIAMLRISHRFGKDSGIGRLAASVNGGHEEDVMALLQSPPPDVAYMEVKNHHDKALIDLILGYGHYLSLVKQAAHLRGEAQVDQWAASILNAHRACQFLCVVRNGPWGVEELNGVIARVLHEHELIPSLQGWYAGRPVMVTRNNPSLRLANGDIGVVLPYPNSEKPGHVLRVAFQDGEGQGIRWLSPNRLEDVETVYALTVHKSQGSEFDHAVLVLPSTPSPVLTRELLYTGITRASASFTLVNPGTQFLLKQAIRRRVYRSGGLGELLIPVR